MSIRFLQHKVFKTELVGEGFLLVDPIKFLSVWFVVFDTQREQKCQDVSFSGFFDPQSFIFYKWFKTYWHLNLATAWWESEMRFAL